MHPETANARLKTILATPIAVVPQGEGRARTWTFVGMSKLDGALAGKLNTDSVLVALQPGKGQRERLRMTLSEREAAAFVESWGSAAPISGGSDAVSMGRGVTGGEQGRGPKMAPHSPNARPAPA